MTTKRQNSRTAQTFKPFIEGTGIDRLYKRVGVKKISFFYQHPDGTRETLATAPKGSTQEARDAIKAAESKAKSLAVDIQAGVIVAGSVAEMIDRFERDIDPIHYEDQTPVGKRIRAATYRNLKAFFGKMVPRAMRTFHGYQYIDARSAAGAPKKAVKDISGFSAICHYGVRWGIMDANPFVGMMHAKLARKKRKRSRSHVVQFYLWALKQKHAARIAGCAALFCYLTGFRAAEVRPMRTSGLSDDGVRVVGAKRKKGEDAVHKVRDWSPKLRTVVARAQQTHAAPREWLFASKVGKAYSSSGWSANWEDAMYGWIASFDESVAADLAARRAWESARRKDKSLPAYKSDFTLSEHPSYFALGDGRPTAVTKKMKRRDEDVYDFAAHADPATTHQFYDDRTERRAKPTE
ncbi:MAG TPA: hypothetical protein VIT92_08940 [Burkholderiaceae bacterium]